MLQVGDAEKIPQALDFESLDPFSQSLQKVCFTAIEEDGGNRLVQLELACEADGVAPPDPVEFGHRCHHPGEPVLKLNLLGTRMGGASSQKLLVQQKRRTHTKDC